MIIFFESGRLGNQLFQYVALRSFFPRPEKIVLVGFDSLKNTFDGVDAVFIDKSNWLIAFLMRVVRKLERMGWLDHIFNVGYESDSKTKIKIRRNIPWLNLFYIKESYFQSENFLDEKIIGHLVFKSKIKESASSHFQLDADEFKIIFIHIRRGDYLYWPSINYPAVINDKWYLNQIRRLKKEFIDPKFFIFTDDPKYVEEFFISKVECNSELVHISESIDLYLMTLCDAGILSPSSYSLWAAILNCNLRNGNFIAPLYWIGHCKGTWYPSENIKFSNIIYEDTGGINE